MLQDIMNEESSLRHWLLKVVKGRSAPIGMVLVTIAVNSCASGGRVNSHPSSSTTVGLPASTAPTTSTSSAAPSSTTGSTTVVSQTTVPASALDKLKGRVLQQIPTSAHEVALTFDGGANADGLPSILETLRAQSVPASFFLTGAFSQSFPSLARQVATAGYRLGDHSVDHPYFTRISDQQIRNEVLDAASTIKSVTGVDPSPLFRFPYGDFDSRTLADVNSLGYVAIGWTIDTLGWEGTSSGMTPTALVERVISQLIPGAIVLMHVGSNPDDHSTLDATALPQLITAIRRAGYTFESLGALLK
jgi:peptidoglycan/xylan/chitin deacetylase (PgdA/CDA1 family)